jgi:hypothetical protein
MSLTVDLEKVGAVIEGDAAKVLHWLADASVKISATEPKAVAALTILLTAVEAAIGDVGAAAANPASLVLTLGTDIADLKAVWPDVKTFVSEFGIKL